MGTFNFKRQSEVFSRLTLGACLLLSLLVAIYLRTYNIAALEGKYLLGNDAYRFYYQAERIIENHHLPKRDMMRWLPLGRDLTTHLNFSSYLIAFLWFWPHLIIPSLTLYQVAVFYPILCYVLTLILLSGHFAKFVFGDYRKEDLYFYLCWLTPVIFGLLAFTRAYRTSANYSSPFALVALGIPSFLLFIFGSYFILRRVPAILRRVSLSNRLPLSVSVTLLAVLCIIAIGISSILFRKHSVIEIVNFKANFLSPLGQSRLMESVTELKDFSLQLWYGYYRMFFLCFSIGILLFLREFCRDIHLTPWAILSGYEFLLVTIVYQNVPEKFLLHIGSNIIYLAAIFGFVALTIGLYVFRPSKIPHPSTGKVREEIVLMIAWFTFTLFFTRGAVRYNFFFAPAAFICGSYFLLYVYRRFCHSILNERNLRYLVLMLILWAAYVIFRSWRLYFLMCAVLLSFGLSIYVVRQALLRKCPLNLISWLLFTGFMIGLTCFFPRIGGDAKRSITAAETLHDPLVSDSLKQALQWMKEHLPDDTVVAAAWDKGSYISALAGKATVTDEDHYIPYWIYLMARHVFCAQTKMEALQFLKAHGVTHLMLDQTDLMKLSLLSYIGSDPKMDRLFTPILVFEKQLQKEVSSLITLLPFSDVHPSIPGSLIASLETFERVEVFLKQPQKGCQEGNFQQVHIISQGERLPPQKLYFQGQLIQQFAQEKTFPGTLMLYLQDGNGPKKKLFGVYLPERGWKTLLVQLYLLEELGENFRLIYPSFNEKRILQTGGFPGEIKIWEIIYPKDLAIDPQYLATEFENPELYRSWILGTHEEKRSSNDPSP